MNGFLDTGVSLQLILQVSYNYDQVCPSLILVSSLLFVTETRKGLPRASYKHLKGKKKKAFREGRVESN